MFGGKVKIRKELLDQAKTAAEETGCSSVEEFIEGAVEKELEHLQSGKKQDSAAKEADDIANKLKGLGYID